MFFTTVDFTWYKQIIHINLHLDSPIIKIKTSWNRVAHPLFPFIFSQAIVKSLSRKSVCTRCSEISTQELYNNYRNIILFILYDEYNKGQYICYDYLLQITNNEDRSRTIAICYNSFSSNLSNTRKIFMVGDMT